MEQRWLRTTCSAACKPCATPWFSGLTLDTLHRCADKLAVANIAQLVNCTQTLFLAHDGRFAVTATYDVFAMHKDHQNGQALRAQSAGMRINYAHCLSFDFL